MKYNMKKYLLLGITILVSFLLLSCATNNPHLKTDLSTETWPQQVETNPHAWTKGADNWFFTGSPSITELANQPATNASMSTMQVNITDFSQIKIDGAFQVQVYGTDEQQPSVFVYGPNAGVRHVAVDTYGDTLYLHQPPDAPAHYMKQVIVRVGVKHLQRIRQLNCGRLEVIRITSKDLCIETGPAASGDMYVAGNINLTEVRHAGTGTVNVFGVNAPEVDIRTTGAGAVNLQGNIGIRKITHHGSTEINIVGANSNDLTIEADGSGKIGVRGYVNLKSLRATGSTCVYIYTLRSQKLSVAVCDKAHVGLAGFVKDLYVDTYNTARFDGRNLCALNAYVRAHDQSHINVTASNKIFASADQASSIYFYGPSALLTDFDTGRGIVMTVGDKTWCNVNSEFRDYTYTYSHRPEPIIAAPPIKHRARNFPGEG